MALTMKATPRAILRGIRDESTRQLPIEPLQLPNIYQYFSYFQKNLKQ